MKAIHEKQRINEYRAWFEHATEEEKIDAIAEFRELHPGCAHWTLAEASRRGVFEAFVLQRIRARGGFYVNGGGE